MKNRILPVLLVTLFTAGGAIAQPEPFTVRITFGHNESEASNWKGKVDATGASIHAIEGWLLLGPDRLSLNTFDLMTGGVLAKGVTISGNADPRATIEVSTNRGNFSFLPESLSLAEPVEFLDSRAQVEKLPDAMKLTDESRQDDFPSLAISSDSIVWAVWQSYSGLKDEVRIARYDGQWKHFTPVPGTSGDVWAPQVVLDPEERPIVVWSQQIDGNFDIFARTLDPEENEWQSIVRLSTHPLPDINHDVVSDRDGRLWVVWQGFRGDNSDIFLRSFDGAQWSGEVTITSSAGNDWMPQVAVDTQGQAYIVWDTYRNGNYDIYLRSFQDGRLGQETAIADTPLFEAQPSVAVDGAGVVWVAWEESGPNWGKDVGPTIDPNWREDPPGERGKYSPGVPLYASRNINMVVLDKGVRKSPIGPFHPLQEGVGDNYDSPQLLTDPSTDRICLLFRRRGRSGPARNDNVYWETVLTFYDGDAWTKILPMPQSWGRISARPSADFDPAGNLWTIWPTDGRQYIESTEPVSGNIYAARIPLEGRGRLPELQDWREADPVEVPVGHLDEAGDLRAIRSYRTFVHGEEKRILRGDFHRHTELSTDLGGWQDGSLIDFYRYVLDAGALDFAGVTDHFAGGHYEYWWWLSEKSCDMYHIPRSFTTFYAYERSARFPHGHRNIIHTRRGVPVLRYFTNATFAGPGLGGGDLTEDDTKLLYESLKESGGLSIPHTPTSTGMGTDWRDNDPEVEPVVEIFQGIRVSSEHKGAPRAARSAEDRPEGGYQEAGFLWNAYSKHYRLGTIASSDHVSTHISYAMVYADEPTREAIFQAILDRHTYGATDNIILDYRMGEHFMGEEFNTSSVPPLDIRVEGTGPIDQIDIIKNAAIIYTANPNQQDVSLTFVDQDVTPGSSYYYVRVLQQDRQIAWSSPIWVNYQP